MNNIKSMIKAFQFEMKKRVRIPNTIMEKHEENICFM